MAVQEIVPWNRRIRAILNATKKLQSYKSQEAYIQILKDEYGEDVALLNFCAHICNKSNANRLHPALFCNMNISTPADRPSFIELHPSQEANNLSETNQSQSLILIYQSRGEQPEYMIQVGRTKIYLDMEFVDAFILCLKIYYLLNLEYPPALKNVCAFWENLLDFGSLKPTLTVKKLVQIIRNLL